MMEITIRKQRGDLLQLKIIVRPDESADYHIDDNCGVLHVQTCQCALDAAARYLNHGHIWKTGYNPILWKTA